MSLPDWREEPVTNIQAALGASGKTCPGHHVDWLRQPFEVDAINDEHA